MKTESPDKPKSVFPVLVGAVLLVLAAVSAFVGFTLYQSKQRYYAEADTTSRNLVMALEAALHSHFNEVDLALQNARRQFRDMHAEGSFTPEAFSSYLRSLKERVPQASSIRGSDAGGMVVYGEDIDPARIQDLKVREFYQRALTERGLVIGFPVKSRISGEMVFPLAYALTYPDGRFGGTAYFLLNNARIGEMMSSLNLGKHGVISLIDTRHRLLHRYPDVAGLALGAKVNVNAKVAAFMATGAKQDSFVATSSVDGERRHSTLRRVGAYPIYAGVGFSERDILAPWYGEVRNGAAFLLVLFLLSAALLAGLRMALNRQQQALSELERKEASLQTSLEALTVSETRFRSLTEGLPQMVWTTHGTLVFDFFSHHWPEYTGLSREQLASADAFGAIVHPDDQEGMRQAWAEARASGGELRHACRLRRHDGSWRVFDNHALPQPDSSGAIVGWVGSSTDITEQREAHDALMLAKDQALAAGRAKSDFLANMSHEIRSPMNAVLGMLQLLQRTPLEARQRDYAAKAETSAKALLGILNDILDYSKVEEGKLALDPHPFSFDKLLRELAVILSANASGKDVEVLFNISPDLPRWVEGDELRLQQVLLNLTGNAIKFTPRGEVVLSASPGAASDDRIEVNFSVRDTGIGIAADKLEHIFDGFSQAEASTARRFGGTGLGLAISQRMVALMGGTLRVSSTPGRGSTFEFTVTMGRTSQQSARDANHALQHLRCLVVDDNPTGRSVMAAIVQSFGWRTDSVGSGDEALTAADAKAYDVILVDWRMPGMDGWETSKRLRQQAPPHRAPLIVMVTAYERELLVKTQGKLDPVLDAMLSKPVTASVLFDTVTDLRLGNAGIAPELSAMAALAAADTRLAGMRLLVVDDNVMNQQVARELLGACGAQIEVADGGRAALAAVCDSGRSFDLILMDIQMPDIDGYAATAEIHARIGPAAPPIVAMTANAMSSDRDAAHAAGMADHVGKPFDLEQLIGVILRHARKPGVTAVAEPALTRQAEPAQLNVAAALARLGGSTTVYQIALRGFKGEMGKLTQQLAGAMESDQAELGAAALHVMKGLAGMIGADRLAATAQQAEQQLRLAAPQAWEAVAQVLVEAELAVNAACTQATPP